MGYKKRAYVYRAFKCKNAPESNIAELVHSVWVTKKKKKKAQLSLFESAVDYICDMITTKQMLKGYGEGSFRGGTGPSIQPLDKRERARNDSILTQIMQPSSSYVNAENEFSPHRKKKTKEKKANTKGKGNSC